MAGPDDGDFELLERWRTGDRSAGSALFSRYFERVFAFFENKVPTEAEDLTQRTFEACVETRDRYRGDASFRSYLFGIARIQLLRWLQRGQRPAIDAESESLADLGVSPSREVARQQRREILEEALGKIPLDYQISIELYYWHELSVPEIAAVLGIPDGTVKSRLNRARRDLRRELVRLEVGPELVESTMMQLAEALQRAGEPG